MSDILQRIDPTGEIALAAHNRYTRVDRDKLGIKGRMESVLLELEERGLLRDAGEPTIAEVREKLCQLQGYTVRVDTDRRSYAQKAVLYPDVMNLLERKETQPVYYRYGDWVTNRMTGGTALYLRHNLELGACVTFDAYYDVWPRDNLRPATPEEIAKARGES